MINSEISQKMILEYCHNHSEQNSSSLLELEKYTWKNEDYRAALTYCAKRKKTEQALEFMQRDTYGILAALPEEERVKKLFIVEDTIAKFKEDRLLRTGKIIGPIGNDAQKTQLQFDREYCIFHGQVAVYFHVGQKQIVSASSNFEIIGCISTKDQFLILLI